MEEAACELLDTLEMALDVIEEMGLPDLAEADDELREKDPKAKFTVTIRHSGEADD